MHSHGMHGPGKTDSIVIQSNTCNFRNMHRRDRPNPMGTVPASSSDIHSISLQLLPKNSLKELSILVSFAQWIFTKTIHSCKYWSRFFFFFNFYFLRKEVLLAPRKPCPPQCSWNPKITTAMPTSNTIDSFYFYFMFLFVFGCTWGAQKFPGQG